MKFSLRHYNRRNPVVYLVYFLLEKYYLKVHTNQLKDFEEIIFIHNGDLGDIILLSSILQNFVSCIDHPITVYTKKSNHTLIDILPKNISYKFTLGVDCSLREQAEDVIKNCRLKTLIIFSHRFNPCNLRYFLGCNNVNIISFDSLLGASLLDKKYVYRKRKEETEISAICNLIKIYFKAFEEKTYYNFKIIPLNCNKVSEKYVLIHPFSRGKEKWMSKECIKDIVKSEVCNIKIVGKGRDEYIYAEQLLDEMNSLCFGKVQNCVDKYNVRDLVCALKHAESFYGSDSFTSHLAASVCKKVYIYINNFQNMSFLPQVNNVSIICR